MYGLPRLAWPELSPAVEVTDALIRLNDCDGKRTHEERDDAPL